METKNKMIKTAKTCQIVAKVLYIVACVVCLTFIVLAIVLPTTNTVGELTKGEVAVLFSALALYAFVCVGLLWNVEGLFKSIVKEQSPFAQPVGHYLKKIAIFVLILSTVPALIGSMVMKAVCPNTEITFPIELGGIVVGVVLLVVGIFFKYGNELQQSNDETL